MTVIRFRPPRNDRCERCSHALTEKTGWGLLTVSAIAPQVNADPAKRTLSLILCGYCINEMTDWLLEEENGKA